MGAAQLWPPVRRESWIFSEAMLEHLGCKGVQAVAVGRKANGCQLFGEGQSGCGLSCGSTGLLLQGGAHAAWHIHGVG